MAHKIQGRQPDAIIRHSMRTRQGRHRLWASIVHPWTNRLDFHSFILDETTHRIVRAYPRGTYHMAPESEVWALVFATAKTFKWIRVRAFLWLYETPFDPQSDPPHPFAMRAP